MKKDKQNVDDITVVKMFQFSDIASCTEYFYNEFGKLKIQESKGNSRRYNKKIRKVIQKSFLANLSNIVYKDNVALKQEKQEVKKIQHMTMSNNTEIAPANNVQLLTD